MRTSRRILLALVAPGLLASCGVASRSTSAPTSPTPSTTTASPTTAPPPTFDGSKLPVPISGLAADGPRVVYLAKSPSDFVDVVAVDLPAGRVLWTAEGYKPFHAPGIALRPSVVDGATFVLEHDDKYPYTALRSVDVASGRTRWRVHSELPADYPHACGESLCVPLSEGGVQVFDPADGRVIGHRAGPEGDPVAGSVATGRDLVVASRQDASLPSQTITATSGWSAKTDWTRPINAFWGDAPVAADVSWAGFHVDGHWEVYLGHVAPPGRKLPPTGSKLGLGSIAAFTVDGQPLWRRANLDPCTSVDVDRIVACEGDVVVTSPTTVAFRVRAILGLDADTGKTQFRVVLDQVLDDYQPGHRVRPIDPEHFVVDTGSRLVVVDVAKGTARRVKGTDVLAWCGEQRDQVDLQTGAEDRKPVHQRIDDDRVPCDGAGRSLTPAQAGAAAAAGRLRVPSADEDHVGTVVRTGGWLVWIDHGHLAAARVER